MKAIITLLTTLVLAVQVHAKPLNVFILAGQSNMERHANVETFDYIGDDPGDGPAFENDARRGRETGGV